MTSTQTVYLVTLEGYKNGYMNIFMSVLIYYVDCRSKERERDKQLGAWKVTKQPQFPRYPLQTGGGRPELAGAVQCFPRPYARCD